MLHFEQARTKETTPFTDGELTREGGLVTGRVVQLADALGCTPPELVEAVESSTEPLVDTAKQNPSTASNYDRPTDPEKRCMAFTEEAFRRLASVVGAREALEGESVPSEIG
jgi:hypothetical protein